MLKEISFELWGVKGEVWGIFPGYVGRIIDFLMLIRGIRAMFLILDGVNANYTHRIHRYIYVHTTTPKNEPNIGIYTNNIHWIKWDKSYLQHQGMFPSMDSMYKP